MYKEKNAQLHNRKAENRGFTLVELIVVLVIMGILLGLAAMGIFGWQDWSKMKQEQANAETIFLAAQNQLNEYAASGSLEKEVQAMIKASGDAYNVVEIVKTAKSGDADKEVLLSKIKSPEGSYFEWDELWSTTRAAKVTDKSKYQGRIVSLRSKPEDYEKYLKQDPSLGEEQKLLFKLITSYIYDKSILNNASIMIEFSPDAAQVFAVCYSDRVDSFNYGETSGTAVSVMDRRESVLSDSFVGYYGVDTLAKAIKGKNKTKYDVPPGDFELRNEELLYAAFCPEDQDDVFSGTSNIDYVINVYNPDIEETEREAQKVMSLKFNIDGMHLPHVELKSAQREGAMTALATYYAYGEPIQVPAEEGEGTVNMTATFRVPVWMQWSSKGERVICFALDAADIQAQSVTYAEAILGTAYDGASYAAESFSQTYSFYRFGLDVDRIYLGMELYEHPEEETGEETAQQLMEEVISAKSSAPGVENLEGEYVAFDKVERSEFQTTYDIKNGRHLYNIRFVEDYADKIPLGSNPAIGQLAYNKDWHTRGSHKFVLKKDIDWKKFTARDMSDGVARENYFLDSYDKKGIKVEGDTIVTYAGIGVAGIDTQRAEFPSFRQLYAGDTFTQDVSAGKAEEGEGESYVISNLTLSTEANELYGLYGYQTQQKSIAFQNASLLEDERKNSYDSLALDRAKGISPTGLFDINYGTLSNITLDGHKVYGAYKVGGFAGENLGILEKLVLRNTENEDGKTDDVDKYMIAKLAANKLIIPSFFGTNLNGITYYYNIEYNNDVKKALTGYLTDSLYGRNTSFVVGIQDVGGIVGYQKSIVTMSGASTKAVYDKLVNEAWVSGQAYLGGIIGRSVLLGGTEKIDGDRYEEATISSTATAYTATGSTALHLTQLKFADFDHDENYGRIQALPIYDRAGITDIDGTDDTDPNTTGSYYIGGIAGMTSKNIENYTGDEGVELISCISSPVYTDEELEEMGLTSGISDDAAVFDETRGMFCGGLVGYARYTKFKDCSTDVPEKRQKEDEHPYIFGWSYVGGFAGAAEGCIFESTDGSKKVKNDTNVVGKVLVGGIAGLLGRPATYGKTDWKDIVELYQLNPQEVDIDTPADADSIPHNSQANDLANTGLTIAFGDNEGTTLGSNKGTNKNMAWCGGICGYNAEQMSDCDSLLSEYAKKQMLAIQSNIDGNTDYLGDRVGGLAGENNWQINGKSGDMSTVNTIVLGESCVGGGVGYLDGKTTDEENNIERSVNNVLFADSETGVDIEDEEVSDFKGSYVRGYEKYTGGIAGYEGLGAVFNNAFEINDSFIVHGKDYVGGFIGGVMGKAGSYDTQFAGKLVAGEDRLQSVRGDGFYTGGFVGAVAIQSRKSKNFVDTGKRISVSAVSEVKGAYFTGGFGGAAILPKFTDTEHAVDVSEYMVQNDKMAVSGTIFSGGYYGYYEITDTASQDTYFEMLKAETEPYKDNLPGFFNRIEVLTHSTSIGVTETKYTQNNHSVMEGRYVGDVVNNQNIDFSGQNAEYVRVGSVAADVLAGGMFGYVPIIQSIRISFTNKASIETRDTLDLGYFHNGYAGGIIGKTPINTVLDACANEGHIKSMSDVFGPLTETNDGLIKNCTVKNAFPAADENSPGYDGSHEYKYVGGLCGFNMDTGCIAGTVSVEGDSEYQVIGTDYAGGLAGYNAGTIHISEQYKYPVSVLATKGSAGGICGINNDGFIECAYTTITDTGDEKIKKEGIKSTGASGAVKITGATYAGIIAGENGGLISGENEDGTRNWIRIPSDINVSLQGGTACGAIVGLNMYAVIYCENDLDLTSSTQSLGGIAGESYEETQISNCLNVGKLIANGGVSCGIAGTADGNALIKDCADFGSADYSVANGTAVIDNCLEAGGKTGESFSQGTISGKCNYFISGKARYALEEEDTSLTEDVIIDDTESEFTPVADTAVPKKLAVQESEGSFILHALLTDAETGALVPYRTGVSLTDVNPLYIAGQSDTAGRVEPARKLYSSLYMTDRYNSLFQ